MSDWSITGSSGTPLQDPLTLGLIPGYRKYTVENSETGEERTVLAYNEEQAIEKAEDGEFYDDD